MGPGAEWITTKREVQASGVMPKALRCALILAAASCFATRVPRHEIRCVEGARDDDDLPRRVCIHEAARPGSAIRDRLDAPGWASKG